MMIATRPRTNLTLVVFLALTGVIPAAQPDAKAPAKTRAFTFTYAATVTGLPAGTLARIWLPVPPNNDDQTVKIQATILPVKEQIGADALYGNKMLFVEAKANADGEIPLSVKYSVVRKEVRASLAKKPEQTALLNRLLEADALVPIAGKPLDLLKGKTLPADELDKAHVFYEVVNGHMRYSKEGEGWGHGDAVWACDSHFGNCTDFHSLFISLARAHKIPAMFEIGFSLPEKRGGDTIAGYHCWAKFRPTGKGWTPVDISEANKHPKLRDYYFGNLTEDRLTFSVGRDIELEPRQAGKKLNYFIYPYVEVDGKSYPSDKVKRNFSFEDVK